MQQIADRTDDTDVKGTLLVSGYQLDQYEIESVLAVGDFRITYYAWDNRADRNVVIHEYYPRSLAVRGEDQVSVTSQSKDRFTDFEFGLSEFLLEARLVSQIRSPYLPNVIEYREANGTGYLVTEYDDGRTIREILDRGAGQFSEKELNELLNASLQGLRELHARNLLHTSVSPTNLFVRYHGHPILLGQGLARYRLAQYTKTYTISLAPGYTPLEQYGLDGNIGPWSDLYSLGGSLYECIAGVRPVDASMRHTSLIKGEQDPLTPAVEIGHGRYSTLLLSNIDWMLKPYMEDRPDSADLMLGVVSFQKQSQKNRKAPARAHTAIDETSQATEAVLNRPPNRLTETQGGADDQNDTPRAAATPAKFDEKGRMVYWGLTLMLIAFVGVTVYQIYKYEIGPKQSELSEDQDSQAVFNPKVIAPEQSQAEQEQNIANTPAENRTISRESDEQRRDFYEGIYKEEEVQRRVEEELKALEQKQREQELQRAKAMRLEIEDLLQKARESMAKAQFLEPAGESAYDYFSAVIALEPQNGPARSGINDIADVYFEKVIAALEQDEPQLAGQHLNNLIKIRPDDPRVGGFLQQITDLKAKAKLEKAKVELEKQALVEKQELLEELKNTRNGDSEPQAPPPADDTTQAAPNTINDSTPDSETAKTQQSPEPEQVLVQSEPEVTQSDAQPQSKINAAELANAYLRYDRGEYSVELFNIMLDAGNADEARAQYILAEMYAAGRGVQQNFAESTFWLKRSLDYVNQNAKYRQAWAEKAMGVIYEKGWYVDSNPERAVRWYRSSADKGYAPAQYRLGLAYAKGLGVSKDLDEAEFWLKKALSKGNQEAKKALSKLGTRN